MKQGANDEGHFFNIGSQIPYVKSNETIALSVLYAVAKQTYYFNIRPVSCIRSDNWMWFVSFATHSSWFHQRVHSRYICILGTSRFANYCPAKKGLIRPFKGLIRPLKGITRPLKGHIRPLKGLMRPFKGLIRPLKCLIRPLEVIRVQFSFIGFLKGLKVVSRVLTRPNYSQQPVVPPRASYVPS